MLNGAWIPAWVCSVFVWRQELNPGLLFSLSAFSESLFFPVKWNNNCLPGYSKDHMRFSIENSKPEPGCLINGSTPLLSILCSQIPSNKTQSPLRAEER